MVEILGSHPRLMVVVGEIAGWSPLASLQQGAEAPTKSRASRHSSPTPPIFCYPRRQSTA